MVDCCICKRKVGGFTEDKVMLDNENIMCHQCTQLFRKVQYAENHDELVYAEENFRNKMSDCYVSEENRERVEAEFQKIRESKKELEKLQEEFRNKRYNFMITTGYNFEGYRIVKYIDLVHGEVVLGTGIFSELTAGVNDLFGKASDAFEGKMSQAKRASQEQMIINAMNIEANAIIGVDFDITTFSNNMIGVSANGTAVIIEKI